MEEEIVKRPVGRPPLHRTADRPEMHVEDPRELAKIREAQILGTLGDLDEHQDEFWYDPSLVPDGWSWEWKRYQVLNEIQHSHINALLRTGWTFVPASKYPQLVPQGNTEEKIIRRGNALMERPASITKMMSDRDKRLAQLQVDTKAAQLEGRVGSEYATSNKGDPIRARGVAGAKKTYAPIPVPE